MSRLQTIYLPHRLTARNFMQFEETYARQSMYERVWEFVDPFTNHVPLMPSRPEILDERGVPKATSRMTEQDLRNLDHWNADYRHKVVLWNAQRSRLATIKQRMLDDLSIEQRHWVDHLPTPRQILIELGHRLRPTHVKQREYMIDDYFAMCAGTDHQNRDAWLQDWKNMHRLLLTYGMHDTIENHMPVDFLYVAMPLLPAWTLAYHSAKLAQKQKLNFGECIREFEANWLVSRRMSQVPSPVSYLATQFRVSSSCLKERP